MATSSTGRQNSRFSTLKVFKLSGNSSKAPPPPPPKDPYYLANPSLASLSQSIAQDLPSNPITPISSRYATSTRSPSPTPSYSTSQYAPSTTVLSPSSASSATLSPDSAGSRRGLFKLPSFTRRPKTPKSATPSNSEAPEPVDDTSISLPWNFQHNIHVDEGFAGMPPTWSASMAQMGFSLEEISLINARRAAARSPTLNAIPIQNFHARTDSSTSSGTPHLKPRSSSLQRNMSDDGSSQRSQFTRPSLHSRNDSDASRPHSEVSTDTGYDQVVYVRPTARSPETPTLRGRAGSTNTPPVSANGISQGFPSPSPSGRQPTVASPSPAGVRSPNMTPPPSVRSPYTMSPLGNGPSPRSQAAQLPPNRTHSPSPQSSSSVSTPSEKDKPPRTPPRRFHVTNDSVSTIPSPPPAYKSPKRAYASLIDDEAASDMATAGTSERDRFEESGDEVPAALSASGSRLPTIPPRLSLHQDDLADLSSWTESLFSIIPNVDKSSPPKASTQPRSFASSSKPHLSASSSSHSLLHTNNNLRATPPAVSRQLPTQKPPPLNQLPLRDDAPLASATPPESSPGAPPAEERTTPLFNEVMNMVSLDKGLDHEELQVKVPFREKENRDSNMSTITVTPATIVRDAAVATRARANVIQSPVRDNSDGTLLTYPIVPPSPESDDSDELAEDRSNSPSSSSESHSSGTAASLSTFTTGSASAVDPSGWKSSGDLSSRPQCNSGPYVESSPLPSPLAGSFGKSGLSSSAVRQYRNAENAGPSIVIQDVDKVQAVEESRIPSPYSSTATSPLYPSPQYPGWVSEMVAPIRGFITEGVDPRSLYVNLQEIAEGESGSVYSAQVAHPSAADKAVVAIKSVTLVPSGTPKLADLERELTVLKNVSHSHILSLDALYVDVEEDALWIRMVLMDRSLADIISLADEGIILQEKPMAQIAKDVLSALDHLRKHGIAHRDLRSDNLLISPDGFVKLADFSNAARVPLLEPTRSDPAGVHFWQAPEVRRGAYNALKVDVWSLGATVWEMAQTEPPFSDATDLSQLGDRWPTLSQAEVYSRSFHDFLHSCSEPSSSRPDPHDLLNTPFIRNAGGRSTILELLSQCKSIEMLSRRQSTDSHGTIS